ncbi:GWxTD domain-containing protein [Chryseolinea sp. T2]|uniref:GWxTD domain-containing protein n=1 Tax=Chryseolinea sp. T2 TaxID=3129255 RepID=UPI00307807EB
MLKNFRTAFSLAIIIVAVSLTPALSQALRDINYSYLYDPDEPFVLTVKPIRGQDGWAVHFSLVLQDTSQTADQYAMSWDIRTSLEEKSGTTITTDAIQKHITRTRVEGTVKVPLSTATQYVSLRILNNRVKRVWIHYKALLPNYPSNGYLISEGKAVQVPFAHAGKPLQLAGIAETSVVSYYNDDFPAAVPPFSEGMSRVSRSMVADSTYNIQVNATVTFTKRGLYLVQKDTSSSEGFAFRIEDDYPRLARIESLADPLIYICTKQEFVRVKEAKGDKKAFDKIILGITGSSQRAKDFMRNYYKRVEWANAYFTSYKEGWKTDRGMIYILFGLPDELYRFSDREVWTYKNQFLNATFNFVRSQTLFDPDNFVLIRDKKYQDTWYEKIDLWRNSRF